VPGVFGGVGGFLHADSSTDPTKLALDQSWLATAFVISPPAADALAADRDAKATIAPRTTQNRATLLTP